MNVLISEIFNCSFLIFFLIDDMLMGGIMDFDWYVYWLELLSCCLFGVMVVDGYKWVDLIRNIKK